VLDVGEDPLDADLVSQLVLPRGALFETIVDGRPLSRSTRVGVIQCSVVAAVVGVDITEPSTCHQLASMRAGRR